MIICGIWSPLTLRKEEGRGQREAKKGIAPYAASAEINAIRRGESSPGHTNKVPILPADWGGAEKLIIFVDLLFCFFWVGHTRRTHAGLGALKRRKGGGIPIPVQTALGFSSESAELDRQKTRYLHFIEFSLDRVRLSLPAFYRILLYRGN